jgi:hypothetical protein
MGTDPQWQVDVEIFGDDTATYARATLIAHHRTLIGSGVAPSCAGRHRLCGLGDDAAVAAALEDLARKLTADREPLSEAYLRRANFSSTRHRGA